MTGAWWQVSELLASSDLAYRCTRRGHQVVSMAGAIESTSLHHFNHSPSVGEHVPGPLAPWFWREKQRQKSD